VFLCLSHLYDHLFIGNVTAARAAQQLQSLQPITQTIDLIRSTIELLGFSNVVESDSLEGLAIFCVKKLAPDCIKCAGLAEGSSKNRIQVLYQHYAE
jgi:hypothetical protein